MLRNVLIFIAYYLVFGTITGIITVGIGITSNKTLSEERRFSTRDLIIVFLMTLILWPVIFISAFINWVKDMNRRKR